VTATISKIRINKYLSEIGYCSRRAADDLITKKKIKINGVIAKLGDKVNEKDEIYINNKLIVKKQHKKVYIALNKPKGVVCTTNQRVEKNNIIDFINYPLRIFPIGRLDKNSEGIIFLTNDGSVVNNILKGQEKEYIVNVHKPITSNFIKKMSEGVPIHDTITKKCEVKQTHKKTFKIVLTQGLNRQIRLMCEALGYKVLHLKRIRIMNIKLDVATGKWRYLTKKEVEEFI